MRTPIIAGNWKMNTTVAEAAELVKAMKDKLNQITGVGKVLCPPFISLTAVKELIRGTSIKLGAQNMYFEKSGAFTGEVSPPMLAGLCEYVILGHSERRGYFGETDQIVNKKVKAALAVGLTPIVCVGESLKENEAGETIAVVTRQVKGAFEGIDSPKDTVIAYEPIWAIGTGKAATGAQANATIKVIRDTVAKLYGEQIAQAIRIQYGGSASSANIAEFISQPDIDGALVGGASLKAADFLGIVDQTAKIKKTG
ncbi:MAG TPA: triose-phosphate isomerase [Dehalococcoidia bacterium]|nr:triose-phosphate isomerase [Dehalococcoidia bacterium]